MNRVIISGHLTKDPELKTTNSGLNCVRFSVALNNGKDKDGNERKADFPTIYVYEKQAENMAKYCKKGNLIGVEGKIKTRDWKKEDGTKGYETYVLANRVEFYNTKTGTRTSFPEPDYTVNNTNFEEITKDVFEEFGQQVALTDEDMPF